MAVFFISTAFWVGWAPVTALLMGYFSHLIADAATKSGVRLLYPSPKRFHSLPPSWRFTTGSMAEEALMPLLAFTAVSLLMLHWPI